MDIEDPEQYTENVAFPPANFSIWPLTRIGAITIDILILIVAILLWVIPRKVFSEKNLDNSQYVSIYPIKSEKSA